MDAGIRDSFADHSEIPSIKTGPGQTVALHCSATEYNSASLSSVFNQSVSQLFVDQTA